MYDGRRQPVVFFFCANKGKIVYHSLTHSSSSSSVDMSTSVTLTRTTTSGVFCITAASTDIKTLLILTFHSPLPLPLGDSVCRRCCASVVLLSCCCCLIVYALSRDAEFLTMRYAVVGWFAKVSASYEFANETVLAALSHFDR